MPKIRPRVSRRAISSSGSSIGATMCHRGYVGNQLWLSVGLLEELGEQVPMFF
jgi:hypothetical protein